ncbi:MAG: CocE/NonD family hydrolase [Alphaproteobacteria bacterium]
MRFVEDLALAVTECRHTEIEMPDGTKLAARIWMPEMARNSPVPAILEYIPYRKSDHTIRRDSMMHRYIAGHGYACIRVDLRGSGDSEGILRDEYLETELVDGACVIEWIASQSWCTGDVGMIGISWGGFNGLQIAARQPPALKAVITVCSTDDRYAEDVHYMGGCLLGDNVSWAAQMFAYNSLPPDPANVGEKWRNMWFQRLEANEPWLGIWLEHQYRDDYWRHGSICEDWSAIKCPVMAASGWADGYTNAVFRMMENLQVPRLGLVGPWSHKYPHIGEPGPAIGFLQECLRWWDRWLKGIDTGIMNEPMVRAWMQESIPPTTLAATRPGRWVGETEWPSPRIETRAYALSSLGRLVDEPRMEQVAIAADRDEDFSLSLQSPLTNGLFAGKWCSYAATPDLPHDQRQEDGGALVFDSDRLDENIEILGAPIVELEYKADQPLAVVALRISDVQPDNKVTRVSYGVRNLSHDDDHRVLRRIDTGRKYRTSIQLNHMAQVFPKGHRIRLAVSTSYWPLIWPAPKAVRLRVFTSGCRLYLPVRPKRAADARIAFQPAEASPPVHVEQRSATQHNWHVIYDLAKDRHTLHVVDDGGTEHISDNEIDYETKTEEWYSSVGDDFQSISAEVRSTRGLRRGDWRTRVKNRTRLNCTEEHFHLTAELDAYEGDQRVYSRNWDRRISRRGV